MLTVAIIATLAAIAIPKFGTMIIRSKEASALAKLGALRSALNIYYADTEGYRPGDGVGFSTALTTGGRYIEQIPSIEIPTQTSHRGPCNSVTTAFDDTEFDCTDVSKSFVWYYNTTLGKVHVNCLHVTTKGATWSLW